MPNSFFSVVHIFIVDSFFSVVYVFIGENTALLDFMYSMNNTGLLNDGEYVVVAVDNSNDDVISDDVCERFIMPYIFFRDLNLRYAERFIQSIWPRDVGRTAIFMPSALPGLCYEVNFSEKSFLMPRPRPELMSPRGIELCQLSSAGVCYKGRWVARPYALMSDGLCLFAAGQTKVDARAQCYVQIWIGVA